MSIHWSEYVNKLFGSPRLYLVANPCDFNFLLVLKDIENDCSVPSLLLIVVRLADSPQMRLPINNDLLVLEKLEFIKLHDHVLFELVSELLDLLPFVRVLIDIIFLFQDSLKLCELAPVLPDGGFNHLHFIKGFLIHDLYC